MFSSPNYKEPIASPWRLRSLVRDACACLHQQMFFWGCDARHREGTLLIRPGLRRIARCESGGDGNIVTKFDSLLRIPKLSQTLLVFVVSNQKFGIGADHTHSEEWRNWVSVLVDITPDRFRTGRASTDRTKGRSNYLYADGHVESLDAAKLKTLIDQGINPAMPPQ